MPLLNSYGIDNNLENGDKFSIIDVKTGQLKHVLATQVIDYVLKIGGNRQSPVESQLDLTTLEPNPLAEGKRYINTVTGTSSVSSISVTSTYVYEVIGGVLVEIIPVENDVVWDNNLSINLRFNGSTWYNLDSEILARQAADTTLQSNIDNETASRIAADNLKVDKITGKALSKNDFTDTLKTKLDGIESGATADQTGAEIKTAYELNADTNAFTDAEKLKVANTPANTNAEFVQATSDWESYTNSQISSESTARQAADTTLQTNIDGVKASIYLGKYNTEALLKSNNLSPNPEGSYGDAFNTTTNLYERYIWDSNIPDFVKQTNEARLTEVVTILQNADGTLQTNIGLEAAARSLADTNLQTNITSEASTARTAEGANATNITNETTARQDADTAIQNELDATQVGAGLNANGSWTPDATTNYLTTATSLKDADKKLDAQAKVNADNIANEITARIAATLTADNTLFIDADNIIKANVSLFEERIIWHTGDSKIMTLSFTPTDIINIFINGSKLYTSSQYTISLPNIINILSALVDNDVITIQYEHIIN